MPTLDSPVFTKKNPQPKTFHTPRHTGCFVVLFVICLSGCGIAPSAQGALSLSAVPSDSVPKNYALAFKDSFPGSTLDRSAWSYRTGVRLLSEQLPSNVVVGSNEMDINVGQQVDTSAGWTGGGVASVAGFRYGYYQVNAQVTANPGWHTSFWVSGSGASTTEIDAFEIDTQTPTQASMGVHSWVNGQDANSSRCSSKYTSPGYNSASAMHSYGFEWTEDGISYYIDGNKVCSQPFPATEYNQGLVNIRLSSVGYTANAISVIMNPSPNRFAQVSYFVRDYYVNALDPGYTTSGSWFNSSLPGFSKQPTQASNDAGASARYTPDILTSGNYDVQVWKSQSSDSDRAAALTVNFSGGSITRQEDFTNGVSGWIDLGIHPFAAGSHEGVVIGYSGTGYARSSMVKFVRQ